jgi:hypothetical protein
MRNSWLEKWKPTSPISTKSYKTPEFTCFRRPSQPLIPTTRAMRAHVAHSSSNGKCLGKLWEKLINLSTTWTHLATCPSADHLASNTWTGKILLNLARIGTTKHLVKNARHYFPIDPNTSHLPRHFQELCHTTAYYFMQRRREQLLRADVTLAPDDREFLKLIRISDESLNKHGESLNIKNVSNPTLESTVMRVSDKILKSSVLSVSDPDI